MNLINEEWWIYNEDKLLLYIDAAIFLVFALAVLYIFVFSVASLKKRRDVYPSAKKKHRFVVLFPAFQEDAVILNSVESFFKQQYPREKYDILVISDQMEDSTNKRLEALSAKVLVVDYEKSTKTKALRLAMQYTEEEKLPYDMVVIMDADNIVKPDYLDQLNNAFYSGCSAIQTHRVAKNRNTSIAVLDAVSEEINNSIFRKGHTNLGFSSALIGSGMAFEYDWFKENILKAEHVGIDKQLERLLLTQNIYIEYLEKVYTYDEKVQKKGHFYEQRRRWIATQFTNLFSGLFALPKAFFTGNWDYCDKLLQWMMPPRILLFGFIILIAFALTGFDWVLSLKWWGLLLLLCISFSLAVPDYLVDNKFRKAIFSIPILFLLMFFNLFRMKGATKEFIHTQHTHNHQNGPHENSH